MPYIVGADEAGYGPSLGPLVVTATLWHVDAAPGEVDLYQRLKPAVTPRREEALKGNKLWLADSKCVYQSGGRAAAPAIGADLGAEAPNELDELDTQDDREHSPSPARGEGAAAVASRPGLRHLERGVLACLAAAHGQHPRDWDELWETIADGRRDELQRQPWHRQRTCRLPLSCECGEIAAARQRLLSAFEAVGVRLIAVRCRTLFADEFNRQVAQLRGKGELLSRLTLQLAASLLEPLPPEPTLLVFDKHGGRNGYLPLLQERFPDSWIHVRGEGREVSRYAWRELGRPLEAEFRARGESHLAVALASMTSKYVRETAMECFNAFWQERLPGLAATAGYAVDARRFKTQIADLQAELGIDDALLWRAC